MDASQEQHNDPARGSQPGSGGTAWEEQIRRFDELRVVSLAHGLVADAERAELAEAVQAAQRQVTLAEQQLAAARADRDDAAVAAATANLAQARAHLDALADRVDRQHQQLAEDHIRLAEEVLDQAGRVFDAGLAATNTLFGFPHTDRRSPPTPSG